MNLIRMSAERQNPNTMDLDEVNMKESLTVMNLENRKVVTTIK